MTTEETVAARIEALVAEEQQLRGVQPVHREASGFEADKRRLRDVEVELDRCWDLLRQRRAREEFGQDPGAASVRDEQTVEHYLQ